MEDDFGQSPLGKSKSARKSSEISEENINKEKRNDFETDGDRAILNVGASGCPARMTEDAGDSDKLGGELGLTVSLFEAKEDDIYGDVYTMEGGSMREGASLLQIRVSKLTQELNTKNLMLEKTQEHLKELQIEVGVDLSEEIGICSDAIQSVKHARNISSINRLQEENRVLEQNISCLFNTAKLELERKDKELKRLQEDRSNSQTRQRTM